MSPRADPCPAHSQSGGVSQWLAHRPQWLCGIRPDWSKLCPCCQGQLPHHGHGRFYLKGLLKELNGLAVLAQAGVSYAHVAKGNSVSLHIADPTVYLKDLFKELNGLAVLA